MTKERDSFGASPDFREHQMEFFCFLPKWAGFRLQFRDGADDHPQEVFRFTRFLFVRSATKSKFLFLTLHRQPRNNSRQRWSHSQQVVRSKAASVASAE